MCYYVTHSNIQIKQYEKGKSVFDWTTTTTHKRATYEEGLRVDMAS